MTNCGSIKIISTWRTWNLRVPASGVIVIVSLSYSHGSLPYIVISYHLWLFYQNRTCQTDHKRYPCFKLSATKRYRSSYRGSASSTLHIKNGYGYIVWQTCAKYKVINTRTYPQDPTVNIIPGTDSDKTGNTHTHTQTQDKNRVTQSTTGWQCFWDAWHPSPVPFELDIGPQNFRSASHRQFNCHASSLTDFRVFRSHFIICARFASTRKRRERISNKRGLGALASWQWQCSFAIINYCSSSSCKVYILLVP